MKLRVLVACEFSGIVRDAFAAAGCEAMSCDLLPTESPGDHYQGDIFDVIDYPWDLMICHPPCTDLAVSGAKHFSEKRLSGRQQAGAAFFMQLIRRADHIPKVAVENPVPIMSTLWRKPDQILQPWQFGHGETKATCLYHHCNRQELLTAGKHVYTLCRRAKIDGKHGPGHIPGLPLQWLGSGVYCENHFHHPGETIRKGQAKVCTSRRFRRHVHRQQNRQL